MPLTSAQAQALRTGLQNETNPQVVQALAVRNDTFLTEWCNGISNSKAWIAQATPLILFEAMSITKFDALSAGKRDAWREIREAAALAPLDFGRNKLRKAIEDIWGADAAAVLDALTEFATRGQVYIGGNGKTSSGVVALDRSYSHVFNVIEVAQALNG